MDTLLITLDGLIGAGKTYCLTQLEKKLDNGQFKIIKEPLDNISITNKYLTDNKSGIYSLGFQLMIVKLKIEEILKAIKDGYKYILIERSFVVDSIFANININEKENMDVYKYLTSKELTKLDDIEIIRFYINEDIDVCLSRIKERNRETVSKEYLELLEGEMLKIDMINVKKEKLLEIILNTCL
jgi:deoxyadenosine/deoxycytidine kinase